MGKRLGVAAGALAVAVAAAPVVRRMTRRQDAPGARNDPRRWHVVTVQCPPEEAGARRDTPLAELGAAVEVQVRPAPGDRGSEIAARLTAPDADSGQVEKLRVALRETRQVLEIGWVVHPDRPGTTRPTALNAPLRAATRARPRERAGCEGAAVAGRQRAVRRGRARPADPGPGGRHRQGPPHRDVRLGPAPARRLHPVHARRATCWATSSSARSSRSGRTCEAPRRRPGRVSLVHLLRQVLVLPQELYSLCDNGNTNPAITETLWGHAPGGCFGYSHAMGGNAGQPRPVHPGPVRRRRRVHASPTRSATSGPCSPPTRPPPAGWAPTSGGVKPGDVVAVWGAGAVGQMAARAAVLLGAERVVSSTATTTGWQRVRAAHRRGDAELRADRRAGAELLRAHRRPRAGRVHRGGRHGGAHARTAQHAYDLVKQQLRLQTDRPAAVREAIYACRKGGSGVRARCLRRRSSTSSRSAR